jgi:hypothetical protein
MEDVMLHGVVSSVLGAGSNNLTVRIYYAGTLIGSFVMPEANRANVGFEIHVMETVRSNGGSGKMVLHGNMDIENTLSDPIVNTIMTIDTTTMQNLTIKAQWSDANVGNSLTMLQARALSIDDN